MILMLFTSKCLRRMERLDSTLNIGKWMVHLECLVNNIEMSSGLYKYRMKEVWFSSKKMNTHKSK